MKTAPGICNVASVTEPSNRLQQVHSLTTMRLHVCNRSAVFCGHLLTFDFKPCRAAVVVSNLLEGTHSTETGSRSIESLRRCLTRASGTTFIAKRIQARFDVF